MYLPLAGDLIHDPIVGSRVFPFKTHDNLGSGPFPNKRMPMLLGRSFITLRPVHDPSTCETPSMDHIFSTIHQTDR